MESSELFNFFTSSRGVDVFWSPLSVALIAGLILALILRNNGYSNTQGNNQRGLSISEVQSLIEEELKKLRPVTYMNNPRDRTNSNDEEGLVWVLGFGVVLLAVLYAIYQPVILDFSVVVATLLFGFFFAGVIFSLLSGSLAGKGWAVYSATVLILSVLALPILYLALHPFYAPKGISNLQHAFIDSGLFEFIKDNGAEKLLFLVFQVLGFLLLYGSWLIILLTLVFISSSAFVATGSKGRSIWLWLSIKTSKFAKPIGATVLVIFLYGVSFVLISGLAYEWWRTASNL